MADSLLNGNVATGEPEPLELLVEHDCLLRGMTDRLAALAADGMRGERLAAHAVDELSDLDWDLFDRCCAPSYLTHAPARFEREIQLPVASAESGSIDTRVLLWPIGACDAQHPHDVGWAAFAVSRGTLSLCEERDGHQLPGRLLLRGVPELIQPAEALSHQVHNHGKLVGLTVHLFGV
jgi:hypothetical protein